MTTDPTPTPTTYDLALTGDELRILAALDFPSRPGLARKILEMWNEYRDEVWALNLYGTNVHALRAMAEAQRRLPDFVSSVGIEATGGGCDHPTIEFEALGAYLVVTGSEGETLRGIDDLGTGRGPWVLAPERPWCYLIGLHFENWETVEFHDYPAMRVTPERYGEAIASLAIALYGVSANSDPSDVDSRDTRCVEAFRLVERLVS